jgi:hypothetical protein
MTYTVYHIHTEPSLNTGYIGITTNYELRMSQHSWKRKKSNAHLRFALAKYGDMVQKSILASGLDRETAEWIERILRPLPGMGWNITTGGGIPPNPKGKPRSAEYCANIAAAKQGVKNPMFGKKVIFSETHRKNLSAALKGKPSPIAKGSNRKQVQCPHCNVVGGEGAMGRWHFDRCRHAS